MKNAIICNPKKFSEKVKKIAEDGLQNLHIVSDFDRTLTRAFVYGKTRPSVISVLRDSSGYLGKEYAEKARLLFEKYRPIEASSGVNEKIKKTAMLEWWKKHFALVIKSGLNKRHFKKIIDSKKIRFRKGALEFFDFLHLKRIPLVVLSSSGLGSEPIKMFFKKEKRLYKNIFVVSNEFNWDKKGKATGYKKPIIHSYNKQETALKNFSFFGKIKHRKNVLLLGDTIGDAEMANGIKFKNIVKIGFLNPGVKNPGVYKKNFDVLILNDSSLDFATSLLKKIEKNSFSR